MRNNSSSAGEKARAYAFLLLKYRLRSEQELSARLLQKKFEPEVVREAVAFLKERRFIDDRAFARAWVASRITKPLGARRLMLELRRKGIQAAIIRETLDKAQQGYDEAAVVKTLAQEKLIKTKGIDPVKAKARVYAYLMRRGFSPDVVIEVCQSL